VKDVLTIFIPGWIIGWAMGQVVIAGIRLAVGRNVQTTAELTFTFCATLIVGTGVYIWRSRRAAMTWWRWSASLLVGIVLGKVVNVVAHQDPDAAGWVLLGFCAVLTAAWMMDWRRI